MKMILKPLVTILLLLFQPAAAGNNIVYGADIAKKVHKYFGAQQINRKVIISAKRAYFPCEEELEIKPRVNGDWSTIRVSCLNPKKWVVTLRTASQGNDTDDSTQNLLGSTTKVVFAKNNIVSKFKF